MSIDYASGLSDYPNKGICGLPEIFDQEVELAQKIDQLYELMKESNYIVVHTGAGISTSCGIPDFRGPTGVWTLEQCGKKPLLSIPFDHAIPSVAHRTLVELEKRNIIKFLITQNIDGLHLRSGFPRDRLAILHGDIFLETCPTCHTFYARVTPSLTMGLKQTGVSCVCLKQSNRVCRGKLHDTILDWEDALPEPDYSLALEHSKLADLHICIGSSLQMLPAANLPLLNSQKSFITRFNTKSKRPSCKPKRAIIDDKTKCKVNKYGSKLVIINLQPTNLAKHAALNIHAPADIVMQSLCDKFGITLPPVEVDVNSGQFRPQIVLRSVHSHPSPTSHWHILPHPLNGSDCPNLPVIFESTMSNVTKTE